ncbi:tripartite tricarboxylate transporter substrate binding protein (plasmid) [Bosea sp. F3-2]|uniref:Bug family tripartite tricarboxylate transporter substrate binding protein n=1 Tax=Bosea sp. F3-2 TaxID=2599640 RepID=UPI0011EBB17C|nr:tripartite tricarboxylate transporter substrate binding protein [Bosea sp. F3-2]QEL27021.1 tripartite tricarboxylate transporter substrate binding protein [Bosea sp. F3-2]
MKPLNRRAVLAGLASGMVAMTAAHAQSWPQRPVTIVVPQAAGSSPDILCRMVAERLARSLGQQFVVENKPGAANVVGTQAVVRAAPDGYTLLFTTSAGLVTNPFTFKKLSYDPLRDLSAIAFVARSNQVIVVTPSVKANSLAELIALEKTKPGSLSIAVDGPRNLSGILGQAINKAAGTRFVLVPYNTISSAVQDTVTGRTEAAILSVSVAEAHIEEKTLRAIAAAGTRRIASMPDLPAIAEILPGADLQAWFMLMGPAGLPAAIAESLAKAVSQAAADPELPQAAAKLGFEIEGDRVTTPASAAAFLQKEYDSAGKLIATLGIEPQ